MSTAVLPPVPAPASTPPPVPGAPRPIKWTCDDLYKMENLPSVRDRKIIVKSRKRLNAAPALRVNDRSVMPSRPRRSPP